MKASIPIHETQRLRALGSYGVMDTPADPALDGVTRLVARLCGAPVAMISLVDETRQWFKAKVGFAENETPREWAFCAHALEATAPLVIPDATRDPRFADNPLVTGATGFRFYAGAPLRTPEGYVLGTLCVFDRKPGQLSQEALGDLTLLADEVMTHLELRRKLDTLAASEARYRSLFEQNPHPMWVYELASLRFLAVNDAAVAHYGYTREEFLAMDLTAIRPPEDVPALLENVARVNRGLDRAGVWRHRTREGRELLVDISSHSLDFAGRPAEMVLALDVTERLQAEEERSRLFQHSLDLLCVGTLDGFLEQTNPAWTQVLGWTEAELREKPWRTLAHPDDQAAVREAEAKLEQGEPVRDFEIRVRGKDGRYRHLAWNMHPLTATRQVFAVVRDKSRLRAEEASRAGREARIRQITDTLPLIVWTATPEGAVTYSNLHFFQYTGVGRDEDAASRWQKCLYPEDLGPCLRAWEKSLREGSPFDIEYRIRRHDGAYRWFRVQARPIRDGSDKITLWFGTAIDIHATKELEAEATRLAGQLTDTLESITDVFMTVDAEGCLAYANAEAERLLGQAVGSAKGQSVWDRLPRDTHPPLSPLIRDAMACGEAVNAEAFDPASRIWYEVHAYPARGGMTIGMRDITARKSLEAQFLRAQRLESIGTLAGGIAHDLNNVFNPIMMASELLGMRLTDENSREILETIGASAKRGAEMVSQVLSFARGVDGQRVNVQVRHLVREVEKIARDTFPKNIRLSHRMDPDLWTVEGDPTQLHQVLLNLCVNARDALPSGGSIRILADNVVLDEHYAAMNIEARIGPHVLIAVEDDGIGIPKEILDKIFDPFFTTKEIGKGTGLGLSTSLAIVKSHGGFIRAYSEPGEGSTFRVYLPARTSRDGEAPAVTEPELPRGNGETILVVDDEASIRQITRQTLEAFGYQVLLASQGAEALELYRERRCGIAVVLTDMMMPVMDGPATILAIRDINPQARIIAASGITGNGKVAQATEAGVDHFLPKPYTAETLLKAIRRILEAS